MTESTSISAKEQKLIEETNELAREFSTIPVQETPTVSEDFFVRVFLPMFAGDEELQYPVTPAMWINIAHSPFAEVRVVDANNRELFLVPPIMDQTVLRPMTGRHDTRGLPSISAMLDVAQKIGKQGASAMDYFLQEEFAKRDFIHNNEHDQTIVKRWLAIFERYNRIKNIPGATEVLNGPITRDSSEFDPLPE